MNELQYCDFALNNMPNNIIIKSLTKKDIFLNIFLCLLLFLSNRTGFITILSVWTILILLLIPIKRYLNINLLLLLLYILLYIVGGINTSFLDSFTSVIAYILPVVSFYLFGRYFASQCTNTKMFFLFVFLVLFFYGLEIYLSIIFDILESGNIINKDRNFYFFNNPSRQLSATLVGVQVYPGLIGFPMYFISKKYSKILAFLYLVLAFLSLLTTVYLLNRTGLIIWLVSTLAMMFYYYRNKLGKFIVVLVCLVGIISFYYSNQFATSEIVSEYSDRGGDLYTLGNRTQYWIYALNNIFTHPFGWGDSVEYMHNMWLDVAKIAGVLPFVILVIMTINSLISLYRILRIKNSEVPILFLGLYICFFLSLFVEPIAGGTHLFLFVMIWGMQESYFYKSKTR